MLNSIESFGSTGWYFERTQLIFVTSMKPSVEVSRRVILLSDKSKSEANVIALSARLKKVSGLDTQVTAFN